MSTHTRLQADLRAAMKARDTTTTATLRMVLAAFGNARVAAGHTGEVTEAEAAELLAREAKKRREAAAAYDQAGRPELAERERAELAIVQRYLPEQLDTPAVRALVDEAAEEVGATGPSDLGRVMAAVMPKVKGRADGRQVNALVRARLGA